MLRVEDADPENLLKSSFYQYQKEKNAPELERQADELHKEALAVTVAQVIALSPIAFIAFIYFIYFIPPIAFIALVLLFHRLFLCLLCCRFLRFFNLSPVSSLFASPLPKLIKLFINFFVLEGCDRK